MLDLGDNDIWYLVLLAVLVLAYFYLRSPTPPKPVPGGIKKPAGGIKAKQGAKPKEIPSDAKARIKVLFGSQTGNADEFAHVLEKEAKRNGIYAQVIDLERYTPEDLKGESVVIFVMATSGEGDPTDNAKEFYTWLGNKELPSDYLSKLNYTVFGLGNSTYEQYNAVARYVDKKLQELGANPIFERGEGDDDSSLEEDFNKWKKRMWGALCEHLGLEASGATEEKFVPRFRLVNCPTSESQGRGNLRFGGKPKTKADGSVVYDIKNPYMARLAVNRELHSNLSDRSCRHIEFDIGNSLTYQPGDHLGVYPENEASLVNHLAQRLNADLDAVVALVSINQKGDATTDSFLGPCTVRQAFTDSIDITTPPRKSVLRALADYATDAQEKQQLIVLSSEAGGSEYNKFIKNDQRTIYEVLQAFPSVNPPLDHILEFLPRLVPRYYSISSSPNFHPGFVHVTSVVVNFTTTTGRYHNGVCSSWMAKLPVGTSVPVFVRESHFRIPKTPAPLVMIGPGTGLAPFRGFLQELSHRRAQGAEGWESALFFGCRDRKHDFIYEEELLGFAQDGTLSHLQMAFSREQASKVYVQDRLSEHKELVWKLLKDKNGYLYICGDARQMAKAVNTVLHSIVCEYSKMTEQQATAFIEELQKSGRFMQDVWF